MARVADPVFTGIQLQAGVQALGAEAESSLPQEQERKLGKFWSGFPFVRRRLARLIHGVKLPSRIVILARTGTHRRRLVAIQAKR